MDTFSVQMVMRVQWNPSLTTICTLKVLMSRDIKYNQTRLRALVTKHPNSALSYDHFYFHK